MAAIGPLLRNLPKAPYRFPDSLKLSQDHFIETKPRGELPELPSLGVHLEPTEIRDDSHLNNLMNKLRRPTL